MDKSLSFIVIGYNTERYLDDCLGSILQQDYSPKEIIYVDSQSTDNSATIARRYTEDVYVIPKIGANYARNFGAKNAKGDILVFVDSNDELGKNVAREINRTVQSGYNAGALYWATKEGTIKDGLVDFILNHLKYKAWSGVFVDRRLFEEAGGFSKQPVVDINDTVRLGQRLSKLTKVKKISTARIFANKDPFKEHGYFIRLLAWIK